MASKDFVVKNGLQVQSNVVVGSFTNNVSPIWNGAIVSGNVGVGTSTVTARTRLEVSDGNVKIKSDGFGLVFPDGSFQTSAAQGTSPGGGTGAVQYKTAAGAFGGDETKFYWDVTNSRLGIGTGATPGQTLYVLGSQPALFNTTSSGDPTIIVGPTTSIGAALGYDIAGAYAYIRPSPAGTEILTVDSSGVGINGVTAINALDVSGAAVIGGGAAYAGSATAPTNGLLVQGSVGLGTTAVGTYKLSMWGGNLQIGTPGTGVVFPDGTYQNSAFNSSTAVTSFSAGTTGFTPNSATTGAVTLAGTLNAANGGTGQSTYAIGDLLYASSTTALSKLADVATGNALISGGVATAPSWGKIGLTTHVTGVLPLANGGTNKALTASNGGIIYSDADSFEVLAASATSGNVLISGGAGAPTWGQYYTSSNVPLSIVSRDGSGNFSAGTITAATGLSVTSGGVTAVGTHTFTGNVTIAGNLIITSGNAIVSQANVLVVDDPIIYLGENNLSNAWDLGIVGSYTLGTYKHTGIVRNYQDSAWTFFDNLTTEPGETINWSQPGLVYSTVKSGNLELASGLASVSNTTGALKVTGGAGISGAINVGGQAFVGSLNSAGTAIVNSLTSNGAISSTTITASTGFEGGYVSGTIFNARTSLIAATVTSNGAISGTTVGGTVITASTGFQGGYLNGTTLNASGAATVNSLTSNGAISGTTIGGTVITASTGFEGGSVSGTVFNARTSLIAATITSNGAVSGTTISGTTGFQGGYVSGTVFNASGAATVNSLTSNGAISGTTVGGTVITASTGFQGGYVSGTVFNASGAATVNSLTSNGAISGTTIGGTVITSSTGFQGGYLNGTTLNTSGAATVNSLTSNGAISGTTIGGTVITASTGFQGGYLNGTTLNTSGAAVVSSLTSNGTVSGTVITASTGYEGGYHSGTIFNARTSLIAPTVTANTAVEGGSISGTVFNARTSLIAATITSNGTISGTTISGSTGFQGGYVSGTVFNASGAATVNSLTSNGAISGTTIGGTVITASTGFQGGYLNGTTLNASGAATVSSLTSNGTVSGTVITASTGFEGGYVSGTIFNARTSLIAPTVTANTAVEGGSVSGTVFNARTSLIAGAITSNAGVTSNTIVLNSTVDGAFIYTSAAATQQAIDTFTAATYRAAQYEISMTSGSSYMLTQISVIHDGTTAYCVEYGTVATGSSLAIFDADISTGSVRLLASPTNAVTTFRIARKVWLV